MLAAWTTRLGGWVCLVMMVSLLCFRKLAYGGQILLGILAVLALLTSGFERWRGKFPAGTGLTVTFFLAAFIINAVLSPDPARTVSRWPFFFWLLMSLPIGLAFVDTQPVRRWGIYALMAGTGLGFLLLLLDLWQNPSNVRPCGSLMGPIPVPYGTVVSLAFTFLLAHLLNLLSRPKGLGGRSGRGLAAALLLAVNFCVIALLLNGSRIGAISALVTVIFLAASYGRRLSIRAVGALLTLLLAAALTFVCRPQTFSRVASMTEFNPSANMSTPVSPTSLAEDEPAGLPGGGTEEFSDDPVKASGIHSNWMRLEMWRHALKKFPEHPFFGYGFRKVTDNPFNLAHFHNTYLQFAVETGLVGLLAVLGLFMPGLRLALKRFDDQDPEIRMWSRIAIALLLALALNAATDYLIHIRLLPYLYGLLTAWAWTRLSPTASKPDA